MTTVLAEFPRVPSHLLPTIISHAMAKNTGRVGRTGKVEMADKARLAVQAHIRHTQTNYEALLKGGTPRDKARDQTFPKVLEIQKDWGYKDIRNPGGTHARRKTAYTAKKKHKGKNFFKELPTILKSTIDPSGTKPDTRKVLHTSQKVPNKNMAGGATLVTEKRKRHDNHEFWDPVPKRQRLGLQEFIDGNTYVPREVKTTVHQWLAGVS